MVSIVSSMPKDSLPTRASLLRRLRDLADDGSWKEFYERYRRFILQAARRKGLSPQDAEDVLQDTVVSVARGLPNFVYNPALCSFKGWLMTITCRRVADQLRRRGRVDVNDFVASLLVGALIRRFCGAGAFFVLFCLALLLGLGLSLGLFLCISRSRCANGKHHQKYRCKQLFHDGSID